MTSPWAAAWAGTGARAGEGRQPGRPIGDLAFVATPGRLEWLPFPGRNAAICEINGWPWSLQRPALVIGEGLGERASSGQGYSDQISSPSAEDGRGLQ